MIVNCSDPNPGQKPLKWANHPSPLYECGEKADAEMPKPEPAEMPALPGVKECDEVHMNPAGNALRLLMARLKMSDSVLKVGAFWGQTCPSSRLDRPLRIFFYRR